MSGISVRGRGEQGMLVELRGARPVRPGGPSGDFRRRGATQTADACGPLQNYLPRRGVRPGAGAYLPALRSPPDPVQPLLAGARERVGLRARVVADLRHERSGLLPGFLIG